MKLSKNEYNRHVMMAQNPDNLDTIRRSIQSLNKTDVIALFPSISIGEERIFFMPEKYPGVLNSRHVIKSGYQSLLGRIGVPFRLVDHAPLWVEIPLVNGTITSLSQRSNQQNVTIRMINNEIRAVLSGSYTAIDDLEIITLLERSFLARIASVSFSCDHMQSNMRIVTREQHHWEYSGYTVTMFEYISNSEIGNASVRCGIGIDLTREERHLSFQFAHDTRTLGRVIHRGEGIPRLQKQLNNLFDTAESNWTLIQNALRNMANITLERLPSYEDKVIASLKMMPEFEAWKTQYDEMRKTSQIRNIFDLIYLMTSIPYRDENFGSVVEEMLFGRFF